MSSKSSKNSLRVSSKSTILRLFIHFLVFSAFFFEQSFQQTTVDDFTTIEATTIDVATIEATCVYSYDSENIYTCELHDAVVLEETDVLEIVGTHLTNCTDADVQIVIYCNTTTKYFKGEVLRKFENLKVVNLIGQGLEEINQNAFEVCANLEEMYIGYDDISAFPPQIFKNCENLNLFHAHHVNITEFPENLFGMTRNLEEFHVVMSQLTSMPEKLLQNIENLKIFNVRENYLTELSPNFFINAVNLKEVDVSRNNFDDQEKITNALNGRTNLTKLLLSFNDFDNFDFHFFAQFTKLEKLAIGSTLEPKLTEISWQSLPGSLITLRIEGIGEELPENSFNHLVNLKSLALSGLAIENLHKDAFKSLAKLEVLSIQETSIKSLHPDQFISQIALIDLNFGFNKIEELPLGIFVPLVDIGRYSEYYGIKMNYNNIQELNSSSFGRHLHLRYIDFASNRINKIERGIFSKFNPNMTYADFFYNLCIDDIFVDATNLDEDEGLAMCYMNWEGTTTPEPTTSTSTTTTEKGSTEEPTEEPTAEPTTTPGGCGRNFKKIEVLMIIFVGFLIMSG